MRTIGLLLLVICFVGCKKSEVSPTKDAPVITSKTIDFSVTSDTPVFIIPCKDITGAKRIILKGTITTTLMPEGSSYVIMTVGGASVWHASLLQPAVDFQTDNLRGLIRGSGIDCKLEFYQVSNVQGPYTCVGSIECSYSEQ